MFIMESENTDIKYPRTYFNSVQSNFPDLMEGEKIDTQKFLDAARGVVELIDRLGKGFIPVKLDVLKNVEEINRNYQINTKEFYSLTDMVLVQKSKGQKTVCDSLLWLKRALNFIEKFLGFVIEDFKEYNNNGEVKIFMKKAYYATLRQYHTWLAQKLFVVLVNMCPNKHELFSLLALGQEDLDPKIIIEGMECFIQSLSVNLEILDKFCIDNNLE